MVKWNRDMTKAPKRGQVLLYIGKRLHGSKRDTMMVARYDKSQTYESGSNGPFVWSPATGEGSNIARDIPMAWAVAPKPPKQAKKPAATAKKKVKTEKRTKR